MNQIIVVTVVGVYSGGGGGGQLRLWSYFQITGIRWQNVEVIGWKGGG